jgi:hypothetical protein
MDVTIKNVKDDIDRTFVDNEDVHKYALLWASKFYTRISKIMRSKTPDEIVEKYPYALYFIKNYIKYFYKYGYYKRHLESKDIKVLYRGLSGDFPYSTSFNENSFISTTWKKEVAEKDFAKDGGIMCIFRVADLPDDVPFVIIDNNTDEMCNESEIVLLPGTITIKPNDGLIKSFRDVKLKHVFECNYTPDVRNIKKLLGLKTTHTGGFSSVIKQKSKHIDYTKFILSEIQQLLQNTK